MKKIALLLLAVSSLLAVILLGLKIIQDNDVVIDPSSNRTLSSGAIVGFAGEQGTQAWLGIPYASPPVGALRWKSPHPVQSWPGTKETTAYGSYCMQIGSAAVTLDLTEWNKASGSEDCLYLNVWAPQFNPSAIPDGAERLPVMLWIHGGGNAIGHAASYDFANLAGRKNLIVVSINFRLGSFGWFSHPALRAQTDNNLDASGNYGLLDIIHSLRWVQDNIAAFGGDPSKVTIFGESAGGFNVVALMASPQAKGLFHRAIIQSGGMAAMTLAKAENYNDAAEPGLDYSSSEILLKLLIGDGMAVDRDSAMQAVAQMSDQQVADYFHSKSLGDLFPLYEITGMGMYNSPKMFRDGVVLPDMELIDLFSQAGAYNSVPTITGTNRDEMKFFLASNESMVETSFGMIKKVIDKDTFERHTRYRSDLWAAEAVVDFADTLTFSGTEVWAYRFDWDEGANTWLGDAAEIFGAAHTFEVPFVMEQWEGLTFPGVFNDDNEPGRQVLSDQMMAYWASFARSGVPGKTSEEPLPEWSRWEDGQLLIFDTASDGGLRMEKNTISFSGLKNSLASDTAISDARERCQLYVQMFNNSPQFDPLEYGGLGCGAYPPEEFSTAL